MGTPNRMRGDGGWIATAAEVVYDGNDDACTAKIAEMISLYGIEAVLECIESCADAAYDHLGELDVPCEGISHADARANVDIVRTHIRAAREVL